VVWNSQEDAFMAHIQLQDDLPGIVGPLAFSPDTAQPLRQLAEVLLRGPSTLTSAERAAAHLGGNYDLVESVKLAPEAAEVSNKLKALLAIAGKVQKGGKQVTSGDVARARQDGATDKEIHDTVLIASAFCMFNRYVDGLATWQPKEREAYREMGETMAHEGYVRSGQPISREVA
jgi:alkylhydroperoxidase/carboxymuconolactone decarboxylase family protein YurZ